MRLGRAEAVELSLHAAEAGRDAVACIDSLFDADSRETPTEDPAGAIFARLHAEPLRVRQALAGSIVWALRATSAMDLAKERVPLSSWPLSSTQVWTSSWAPRFVRWIVVTALGLPDADLEALRPLLGDSMASPDSDEAHPESIHASGADSKPESSPFSCPFVIPLSASPVPKGLGRIPNPRRPDSDAPDATPQVDCRSPAARLRSIQDVDHDEALHLLADHRTRDDACPFASDLPKSKRRRWELLVLVLAAAVLGDRGYDARTRATLCCVAGELQVPWELIARAEDALASKLALTVLQVNADRLRSRTQTRHRWIIMGAAGVIGGGLLVLTGGLAAPAVAAGIGALGAAVGGAVGGAGIAVGAWMTSAAGTAVVLSLFGAAGTSLASYRMSRRTAGLTHFEFHRLSAIVVEVDDDDTDKVDEAETTAVSPPRSRRTWSQWLWGKKDKAAAPPPPALASMSTAEASDDLDGRSGLHVYVCVSGLIDVGMDGSIDTDFLDPWGGAENALVVPPLLSVQLESLDTDEPHPADDGAALRAEPAAGAADPLSRTPSRARPGWFRDLVQSGEIYSLVWEPAALAELQHTIQSWLRSAVLSQVTTEVLTHTALRSLLAAWTWPSYATSVLAFIDTPWQIALDRARKAGVALADALESGAQGRRPVTLIGYSIGARVIFECCLELARRADEALTRSQSHGPARLTAPQQRALQAASGLLVEDVILLGAPISTALEQWRTVRRVAAGRVINGYCPTDWVLRFVFRANAMVWGVAGVAPIGVTSSSPPPPAASATAAASAEVAETEIATAAAASASSAAEEAVTKAPDDSDDADPAPSLLRGVLVDGIESIDLSPFVSTHLDYKSRLEAILSAIV